MIVELSQVAKVDTVELAQHEPYTSLVHEFELLGRQSHPRADLKDGGGAGGGPAAADFGAALVGPGWLPLGRYVFPFLYK